MKPLIVLVTGATGLVGGRVIRHMLEQDPRINILAVVRNPEKWRATAAALGLPAQRVRALHGDVTRPGLEMIAADRQRANAAEVVVHAAGDICFSRSLADARVVNLEGTRRVLDLADTLPVLRRMVYVSTAFVAGRLTGTVPEAATDGAHGWVNGYEQSKHEAEALVRAGRHAWTIVRPSAIVCDTAAGDVSQINAVHRALHLHYAGLAALMPGEEDAAIDFVTSEYVAESTARLALRPDTAGGIYHLCAGDGAVRLGALLDLGHAVWSESPEWRGRGIARPALTDLETYRLFERTVVDTGDARLCAITRSLAHFVPQLALPKQFITTATDAILGRRAPAVQTFLPGMLRHLVETRWRRPIRQAA